MRPDTFSSAVLFLLGAAPLAHSVPLQTGSPTSTSTALAPGATRNVPAGLTPEDWNGLRAAFAATVVPYERTYLKASNAGLGDRFGLVAVSGDTAVVGAVFEDSAAAGVNGNQGDSASASNSGAVYVFVRSAAGWTQQAYLKASNPDLDDDFGFSVSISGDTIVVGAIREESSAVGVNGNQADNGAGFSGAAYVFVRNGTTWSQQAYLKASNTQSFDGFGWSVAVDGDTIVVGAALEDSAATTVNGDQSNNAANGSGAAYVFVRNGSSWSQQAYLKASNSEGGSTTGDSFGWSVSVSGHTLVVGAPNEAGATTGVDGNQADNGAALAGAAYVFVRNGSSWSQQAYLKASNTDADDLFGWSVSVSGDTLAVAARGESSNATTVDGAQGDNSAPRAGAAYVFTRNGATWSQSAYLKASNAGADDEFGRSVSISGDAIVVGSAGESSTSTIVNGDQASNGAADAGAAYVFARQGTSWSQTAYLKAPNAGAGDQFGGSVSVSGATILVGALGEDGVSTGVGGDPHNDAAADSGAAYLFVLDPFPSFCNAEDGSLAACYCANAGNADTGCDNAQATGGVRLDVLAQTTGPNQATLAGAGFPTTGGLASIVMRSNAIEPSGAVLFGDGVRCVGATGLVRLGTAAVTGGTATHVVGHAAAAGSGDFYYQLWYRETPSTFCDPFLAFNLSSGRAIAW